MKKKIITLFLTISVFFNNSGFVFSNTMPVPTVPISYELLMGLMSIGLSFGLALPQTDEEYYDYTNSLRNHLQLVDEDYIKKLDEHFKNNNSNDKKFQIPYVPGILEKLFDNVGKEVSKPSIKCYSYGLGNLPIYPSYNQVDKNAIEIPMNGDTVSISYINVKGEYVLCSFKYYNDGNKRYLYKTFSSEGLGTHSQTHTWTGNLDRKISFALINKGNDLYPGLYSFSSGSDYASGSIGFVPNTVISTYEDYYIKYGDDSIKGGVIRNTTSIDYNPTVPEIDKENNILTVPSIPNLSIPNSESLPGLPPFDVSDPLTNPDGDTNPNPDGDTGGLPSFPNMGDELDFSPLYMTNIKEKFPFSLPWDFKNLINMFDVEPVAPKFEVPFLGNNITLDFSYFEEWAVIVRFFIFISFTATLIFISTKMKG